MRTTETSASARPTLLARTVAEGRHAPAQPASLLGRRLEHGIRNFRDAELFVVGLLGGDHRRVRSQHEVDPRVRHEVRLELGDVHVQSAVEAERRGQRRDALADEAVKIL